jgi:hypothetical protein
MSNSQGIEARIDTSFAAISNDSTKVFNSSIGGSIREILSMRSEFHRSVLAGRLFCSVKTFPVIHFTDISSVRFDHIVRLIILSDGGLVMSRSYQSRWASVARRIFVGSLLTFFMILQGDVQAADPDRPAPTPLVNAISASIKVPSTSPEMSQRIDQILLDSWKSHGLTPAEAASDEELTRRLYLDLLGRIPTVAELRTHDKRGPVTRRGELIETLLEHPDFSSHMASVWRRALLPATADLSAFGGTESFERWLQEEFDANTPYDELAQELLLSSGRVNESGPVLFFTALQLKPDEIAKQTSRAFLGMRIDCAQCHDHPFDHWKQDEFWGLAAFFSRISKPEGKMEMLSPLLQVKDNNRGDVMLPETEEIIPPRYLMGEVFRSSMNAESETEELSRREAFVVWLTSRNNHQFAKAAVNRVWAQLFGRGIVDPVDDMGVHNPPQIPELLDALALYFIQTDYDLRNLVVTIINTKAYQLSSRSETRSDERAKAFAQMSLKTLTAEQLYDCIAIATHREMSQAGADQAGLLRLGSNARMQFISQFQTTGSAVDYQAGIPQALTMMNGILISDATDLAIGGVLTSLSAPFFTDNQRVETLYLATLSRKPRPEEMEHLREMLSGHKDQTARKAFWADLYWALLNSPEFTFNH